MPGCLPIENRESNWEILQQVQRTEIDVPFGVRLLDLVFIVMGGIPRMDTNVFLCSLTLVLSDLNVDPRFIYFRHITISIAILGVRHIDLRQVKNSKSVGDDMQKDTACAFVKSFLSIPAQTICCYRRLWTHL